MAEPTTLREIQTVFFRQLTSLRPLEEQAFDRWIVAESRDQARARLGIYKDMYFFRLRDVLRRDFSAVERVVGPDLFQRLAAQYLDAHPSRNPSVRHLGRELPAFLQAHPSADRFPWLAELARLEWTRGEMIDAPDSAPIPPQALAALVPESWPELRFGLVPAHQLLQLDYPVHTVWLAAREDRELPLPLEPAPSTLVIWRQAVTVRHQQIPDAEAQLLGWLGEGLSLEEIGTRLQAADPDRDNAQLLATTLRRWVVAGLLRSAD